jgi:hypothetical protein
VLLPVAAVILIIATGMNTIFNADDKRKIREFISGGFGQLRSLLASQKNKAQ